MALTLISPEPLGSDGMDTPSASTLPARLSATGIVTARVDRVWGLWTTKRGLEAWWAPEGFVMKVQNLDVSIGGRVDFLYEEASTVGNAAWRRALFARGVSTRWTARGQFLEVTPLARLAFRQSLDFGRSTRLQEYRMEAEFHPEGSRTRLVLAAEAPATKHWSLLGERNLVGQLDRLRALLD